MEHYAGCCKIKSSATHHYTLSVKKRASLSYCFQILDKIQPLKADLGRQLSAIQLEQRHLNNKARRGDFNCLLL